MAFAGVKPLPFDHVVANGVRWNLSKRLGQGKFAVVYLATRAGAPHDRRAAKVLDTTRMSAWGRSQLRAEVDIWRRLDHPHICRLHDSVSLDCYEVLLLDYEEGGELFERIVERETFTEREAARLMHQLLSALSYLHFEGALRAWLTRAGDNVPGVGARVLTVWRALPPPPWFLKESCTVT